MPKNKLERENDRVNSDRIPKKGNIFYYYLYFCQFTIYLTVQKVISKYAISGRLGGGNCPTAVLT
jgi:hypothetical protein